MNASTEPALAPPGAGLPRIELYLARCLFALRRWTGNRDSFNARFQRERQAIHQLVRSCDPAAAARRVLIQRPRGLEDSSRYWSVWMTLDHLRIVNHHIVKTISALASGITPSGQASTAAVKPSPAVTADVEGAYEHSCNSLLATVAQTADLKTRSRFAHPWFGSLNASGWHALAAVHMGVHREQIRRILHGPSRFTAWTLLRKAASRGRPSRPEKIFC